ncbi:MAG: UbiA family prenyltransferase [Archangiaceae bacterium]|nr:UbiA family prenyltransferase [Archangiaceae bacterium]
MSSQAATPLGFTAALSVGRAHIVAIAALGALTFGQLFTGTRLWAVAAVVALDWFLVNLLNRVVDLEEDRINRIAATDFVARHRRALTVGAFSLLFGSLAAVHLVMPAVTPWRIAYHLLGAAYNWPLLPGRRRLKELYFWKNTASAMGFMLTVFGYPLAVAPRTVPLAWVASAAAFFFLFELSYEVLYDLRDVEGDRAVGARTWPAVHGARVGGLIAQALLGVSAAILLGAFALGLVPWAIGVLSVGPVVQWAYFRSIEKRGVTSADCIRLTWIGAALLAAYQLWCTLGLPGSP